jgi:circadian clock protein KaiB
MGKFVLKLYIAGSSPRSQQAIGNLRRICAEELPGSELEVIDVLEQPHLAEGARILATPTLIKELPQPVRRLIGDLSDVGQVLLGLDLQRKPSEVGGSQ